MKPVSPPGTPADLRVEHFHPKSDAAAPTNWHLEWSNLLACCHDGSRPDVADAAHRRTSPDHSCDVPKGSHDWTALILNPLHLPASPALFNIHRHDGRIEVNQANCAQAGIDPNTAQETIDRLRLDANRLRALRKAELDRVNDLLRRELTSGLSTEDARHKLARALLRKDPQGYWPKFFTAIRGYLGRAAEDQLNAIAYSG